MRIESLQVALRLRTPWEAMELGTALVRESGRAIWIPWLLAIVPIFALVTALSIYLDMLFMAWLVMWWIKPVFDRIPLYVISRRVFGIEPTVAQTLKAFVQWTWKATCRYLTLDRFSFFRAILMPIDFLEGEKGKYRSKRKRVLVNSVYGAGSGLMWLCQLFVVVIALSAIGLILVFIPAEYLSWEVRTFISSKLFLEEDRWLLSTIIHSLLWLGVTIIEPFYMGAGFGIYLSRRTQLEAWDVEIIFKKMRDRLQADAGGGVTAAILALAVLLTSAQPVRANPSVEVPQEVQAQNDQEADKEQEDETRKIPLSQIFPEPDSEASKRFSRQAQTIKNDPGIFPEKIVKRWKLKEGLFKENEKNANNWDWWKKFMDGFSGLAGGGLRIIFWLMAVLALVAVLLTIRKWLP